jgi:argonaute-like protein implicated in RNA metabolism and viral defense
MPIRQEQVLALIVAGEQLETKLKEATTSLNKALDEVNEICNRIAAKEPSRELQDDIQDLISAITTRISIINEQLFISDEYTRAIHRWRDHYNLRYKANLSSRKYKTRYREQNELQGPLPEYTPES